MAPKRKKKVSHAVGEAERRLWQYLAVYIAVVLLFCSGTLMRYDLEAAEGEPEKVELQEAKTKVAEQVEIEEKHLPYVGNRRAVEIEDIWGPNTFEEFINWLTDPFDRNSKDK